MRYNSMITYQTQLELTIVFPAIGRIRQRAARFRAPFGVESMREFVLVFLVRLGLGLVAWARSILACVDFVDFKRY